MSGTVEKRRLEAGSRRRVFLELDRRRREAGISVERLTRAAGISAGAYFLSLGDNRTARPETLARLRIALRRLKSGTQEGDATADQLYRLAVAYLALLFQVRARDVLASDPGRRATRNPEWLAAAKIRQQAIYLVNVCCGVRQAELAAVTGLTAAAISQAVAAVEDSRDADPSFDALLDELGAMLWEG